ncbi:MAG TPA: hydantoinase/carbamoylase family amidase [Stellaceae bacterium]|jgi:N-carbamoyl-L-amino-acid hydrolase|nr:hydantoinase/carbamoylase family amidase [Stellaceae bacterium]
MPRIDGERVVADLKRLAEFGRYKTGVHRPTYSPDDVASRHWLSEQFAAAGLLPEIDGIGNVFGRNHAATRHLLVGSHSETQPYGGWLDGALGVIYALELARAFAGDPDCAGLGIDTIAWADEEGHYGQMLGSRSFTGTVGEEELAACKSREGVPLSEALDRAGFAGRKREAVDPGRYVGYLEAHIEQGDTLEASGRRIGIVEAIVGIRNFMVTLSGQQNHAGTTQMARRRDAGVAMVRLAARIHDRFAAIAGPRTVWTIGRIVLAPNAPSIVPGRADMQVQFRDIDPAQLAAFEAALYEMVGESDRAGPCRAAIAPMSQVEPRPMDGVFQSAIEAAAQAHAPGLHLRMPSGAGHDAQILSHRLRAGMMFIPSINGVSHHWSEDTSEADIVLGAQVFADAACAILKGA